MNEKIGFVGLGTMGAPMAERLQNAGHPLFVFNRTPEKTQALVDRGAHFCRTPAETASESDFIFSMLSNPGALEEIALGEKGILSGLRNDRIHIDCSTVSPDLTARLVREYEKHNCRFLHAPVLGSVPQVIEGTLLLFVGGEESAFVRVEPVLKRLGSKMWRFDRAEQATTVKLLCNSFISGMAVVLSQAILLSEKSGINPRTLLEIISQSQLNAPMYQAKGSSMINRTFAPRFFVEHLFKDINLVLDVANTLHVQMPAAETAQKLYRLAMESGLSKEDYSVVIRVLEAPSGQS